MRRGDEKETHSPSLRGKGYYIRDSFSVCQEGEGVSIPYLFGGKEKGKEGGEFLLAFQKEKNKGEGKRESSGEGGNENKRRERNSSFIEQWKKEKRSR